LKHQRACNLSATNASENATAAGESLALERHYNVKEVAALWKLSCDTVREMFINEPDVTVIGRQRAHKRHYRTLRIPESVVIRVHRRLSN
jgi:hypothetical protein